MNFTPINNTTSNLTISRSRRLSDSTRERKPVARFVETAKPVIDAIPFNFSAEEVTLIKDNIKTCPALVAIRKHSFSAVIDRGIRKGI